MFLVLCKSILVLQWQGEFYYIGKFSRPHGFKQGNLDFHSVYRYLEGGRPLNSCSPMFYTQNWSEGLFHIVILMCSVSLSWLKIMRDCQRQVYGSQTTEISRKMFFEHELLWRRSYIKVREGYILNVHGKPHSVFWSWVYRPS